MIDMRSIFSPFRDLVSCSRGGNTTLTHSFLRFSLRIECQVREPNNK